MLQTKPLQDLLSQVLSPNIHTAVIATAQGTLIAHAVNALLDLSGQGENARRQARSLGAIATAVWKNYASVKNVDDLWDSPNGDANGDSQGGLVWIAVECEVAPDVFIAYVQDGQLLLYQVPPLAKRGLLLALAGKKDAPIGMMRQKVIYGAGMRANCRLN